jgi:hypothetical protein
VGLPSLLDLDEGTTATHERASHLLEGSPGLRGVTLNTYERLKLSVVGSFEKLTGLAALGTRETLAQLELL